MVIACHSVCILTQTWSACSSVSMSEELQRKQGWYKAKQGSLTREEEAEYVTYCNDAMFRIHILEQRLNR